MLSRSQHCRMFDLRSNQMLAVTIRIGKASASKNRHVVGVRPTRREENFLGTTIDQLRHLLPRECHSKLRLAAHAVNGRRIAPAIAEKWLHHLTDFISDFRR